MLPNCPRDRLRAGLFLLPSLLGTGCFFLIPMGQVLVRSFQNTLADTWVGLENYRQVLENLAFQKALRNTTAFTAVCIPALLVISLALALGCFRLPGVGKALRSAFLMPMAVPAASVVLVWKALFHNQGLLNGLIARAGGEAVLWMNSDAAFWMLVASYLWKNLGYTVVLWTAGLAAIPESQYQAAQVDGAGSWQRFRWITLPNLKGSAYTIGVMSLLNSFKVFREAWLVAGDYPHESMYLLQHLYNNWFRELAFDKIAAASVMTALVVLGLIWALGRAWNREEEIL